MKQEYIRPNLWQWVLGSSTTSRKSVAVNKARKIYESATDTTLPDSSFSFDGYLESLSERPIMHNVKDEASGLMAKLHQKYNDGIFDFECSVYDGTPDVLEKKLASGKSKTTKTYTIANYYVTKLYATTPDKLSTCITINDFMCGYGYRWLYNYPKYKHERMPLAKEQPEDVKAWQAITGRIRDFYNIFQHDKEIEFDISDSTMKYYDDICIEMENRAEEQNNDILHSIVGRAQIHILKIAMLLELGKAPVSTTITDESIQIAAEMVTDYFIPSEIEIIDRIQEDIRNNQIEKIISILRRLGGEASHTKLLRDSNMKSRDFIECIATMIESRRIKITQEKPRMYKLINQPNPLNLRSVREVRNVRTYIEGDNTSTKITKTIYAQAEVFSGSVYERTNVTNKTNVTNFDYSEPDVTNKIHKSLINASQQFEREYGGINSSNVDKFSYWYRDKFKPRWFRGTESGVFSPAMILPIACKVFRLTPPLPTPLTSMVAVMKHHATDVLIVVADAGNSQGQNSQICYTCGCTLPDADGHTNISERLNNRNHENPPLYYCDRCFLGRRAIE